MLLLTRNSKYVSAWPKLNTIFFFVCKLLRSLQKKIVTMSKARKCPFTFNLEPPLKRTRGKNVSEEEKIVCKYFKERGATNLSISELTGIGSKSIANILSKDSLKNRKGQGRKRITTEEEDDEIIKRAKKFSRKGSRQLAPDMERKYEIKISSRTFRRRVQEAGGFWGHQKTKYIMRRL